jgi:hypothetical protein
MARWAAGKDDRAAAGEAAKQLKADFHTGVASEIFTKLPAARQKEFGERAKKTAQDARAAYKKVLTDPPSQAPQDRQG